MAAVGGVSEDSKKAAPAAGEIGEVPKEILDMTR